MNIRTTLIAAALAAVGSAQAQSATYAIEPTHTFVTFEISHFGTSTNRGRFDKKEGTVQFDRAGKSGKVELTLDMNSINTGTAPFDKHLKSADLFNTEAHPTAKFVSDKFSFNGDKVTEVAGLLTLKGKTNPVTLKASNFNCDHNINNLRTKESLEKCLEEFMVMLARPNRKTQPANDSGVNSTGLCDIDPQRIIIPILHCQSRCERNIRDITVRR